MATEYCIQGNHQAPAEQMEWYTPPRPTPSAPKPRKRRMCSTCRKSLDTIHKKKTKS